MVQPGSERTSALDDQLCFALYAASRAITGCYRPMLDAVGLTYPQYLVMLVLWERGTTRVTAIGHALQLETGTLSPLLERLEAGGLVTRTRQTGDERSVLVSLTATGQDLEARVADVQRRAARAAGLSRAEVADLRASLNRLTGRLRAVAGARSA
jgi:MarR family transcriptional regulator, organic hydroperoxide resistance regulator